jgi:hypothetical protein
MVENRSNAMSSTMMMERTSNGSSCTPAMTMGMMGTQPGWCMIPRCEVRVENCNGGMRINCRCEDETACNMLQNLCKMLAGGMCSCCCTRNGMTIYQCNLFCGACKCECTTDGVCITCTSGDKTCCQMLQACCECLATLIECGCGCQISFNNTAVCCDCGAC